MTLDKKEKVNAELDGADYAQYTISGNESQAEMQNLVKNMNRMQSELGLLYQQYQGQSKTPDSKEAQALGAQIQTKSDNLNQYVTSVIQNSKGTLTKYYLYSILLQQFQNQPVPDQLVKDIKVFTDKINKEMKNTPYATDFQKVSANLEAQKIAAAQQAAPQPASNSKLEVGSPAPDID